MVVFGADGVSVAVGVIVVVRLGGVPHRGARIVALAAGAAPAVLIQARGHRHERPAAPAVPIAEVARQEAPAHVPAPQHASGRLQQVGQKQRLQRIEAPLRLGAQRAASNGR